MKKANSSSDSVSELYRTLLFAINAMKTAIPNRLGTFVIYNDESQESLILEQCWKHYEMTYKADRELYKFFADLLTKARKLRSDESVSELVFLTFGDEKRMQSYADEAIDQISRSLKLYLYLTEELGYVQDRQASTYAQKVDRYRERWRRDGFDLKTLEKLEANLLWESAKIHEKRRLSVTKKPKGGSPRQKSQGKKEGSLEAAPKDVLKAFLFKHHNYEKESLTQEVASTDAMMQATGKSKPTITRYLRELQFESYAHYVTICEDYPALKAKLDSLEGKLPDRLRSNRGKSIELTEDE